MYHSLIINGVNTWEGPMEVDGETRTVGFHIVPTSRPKVAPPSVKTQYVDIPGSDGQLDYTEYFGKVYYGPRTGSWEFKLIYDLNDIDDSFRNRSMRQAIADGNNKFSNWISRYTQIMSAVHGKKCRILLEDEPEYYYEGRLSINDFESNEKESIIKIDYSLEPYKYPTFSSTAEEAEWLWDDLFETIIYYGKFSITNGTKARNLYNPSGSDISSPDLSIKANVPIQMYFDDDPETIYTIAIDGTVTPAPIVLQPGSNNVTFTTDNTANVEVDYKLGPTL